ncbi:MAG TPA: hypothetical protein VGB23_05000 [Nitrospirota bacterium]
MKSLLFAALFAAFILSACVVPGPHGRPVLLAPPLPPVVVLEGEPYYYNEGYHYYYHDNGWYYSRSRGGPWEPLPRDRYPKEIRHKDRHERGDRDRDRDHDRGRDRGDRYRR